MTREQITDEMVHAVIVACGWEERDDAEQQARAAIEAVSPMIREQATGGSIVANEEGEFVDCILADVPYVSRVLPGGVPVAAVLLDMQTRKVIGLRVYSAAAIRAMKEQP
jgi:hypothetical protein